MAWKEGERVRIMRREVTDEDRKNNTYFAHMADLTGVIENVYSQEEIVVKVDSDAIVEPAKSVMAAAAKRMHARFAEQAPLELRNKLSDEELKFPVNYVLLVQGKDLQKV